MNKGYIIDNNCKYKNGELVNKNDKVYSCTLNQTDIETNKNKFYIMQLIKETSQYILYIRYGRVGENGKIEYKIFPTENEAISTFEKQFRSKTSNNWNHKDFIKKDGKYFLSNISYEDELKNIPVEPKKMIESKLPERVQTFIRMVTDMNMLSNTLVSLDIDTKKMPLGKINKTQLDKAKSILEEIKKYVNNKNNNQELLKMSSEYYTYIPYSCGRKKPPVIDNEKILEKYNEIIDELQNIIVGVQIINNTQEQTDEHPIDNIYKNINTQIKPLDESDTYYKYISEYINNTHGPTHGIKLELLDILEVSQNYKTNISDIKPKMLLFHGTPQSCVLSIFKNDFYLDPSKLDSNIQIAGKMFGYGIYFADCCTKSMNYCRAMNTNNIGCLLICEVSVGKIYECVNADSSLNKNKIEKFKCQSTKGLGLYTPSSMITDKNIIIPSGKLSDTNKNAYLRYNEYIVYDTNQIRIKYIAIVKNIGNYNGW